MGRNCAEATNALFSLIVCLVGPAAVAFLAILVPFAVAPFAATPFPATPFFFAFAPVAAFAVAEVPAFVAAAFLPAEVLVAVTGGSAGPDWRNTPPDACGIANSIPNNPAENFP
jgi:hypothetical protein